MCCLLYFFGLYGSIACLNMLRRGDLAKVWVSVSELRGCGPRCCGDTIDDSRKTIFAPLAKREDCPICLVRLPLKGSDFVYMPCCGKDVCCACICAYQNTSEEKNRPCPFCRSPRPKSQDEVIEQMEKRVKENDTIAMHTLAHTYLHSEMNKMNGLRLLLLASELGE